MPFFFPLFFFLNAKEVPGYWPFLVNSKLPDVFGFFLVRGSHSGFWCWSRKAQRGKDREGESLGLVQQGPSVVAARQGSGKDRVGRIAAVARQRKKRKDRIQRQGAKTCVCTVSAVVRQ